MKTYQVTLPDELAAFVDRMLAEGKWDSADHLVAYGLLRAQDDLEPGEGPDTDRLAEAVRVGIEQADRGELADGPAVIDRLRKKLLAARKQPS